MMLVARTTRVRLAILLGALLALGLVTPAGADEAKTPINASLFLTIMSAPVERREAAFDEALKGSGLPALERGGVVQPDGSVRYGNVSVTVKNPCPPGTAHYEPPPLPGRRVRN